MNPANQTNRMMHFKSAQIAGLEISPNDMAQINQYALAPLSPEDIFAFKVSMAGNEVDRDFEVFPRTTLSKLASLFIGKTVVKDHDHRSDNQIARIYATDLVESGHTRLTKNGEVFTELIAKCYMVKTSTNADLIAEIRAGIRKEVSLGCSIGKAVCSICGTDNVKTYCAHFGGRQYDGETCYFSLEEPRDAYELSFVAIPAQQHAGTVKSYGEEPCYKADMEAREKAIEEAREILRTREKAESEQDRLTVNRLAEEARRLMVNRQEKNLSEGVDAHEIADSAKSGEHERKSAENAPNAAHTAQNVQENAPICADCAPNEPENEASEQAESILSENLRTRESLGEQQEDESRLTVNQANQEEAPASSEAPSLSEDQEEQPPSDSENKENSGEEEGNGQSRLIVNRTEQQQASVETHPESCAQEPSSPPTSDSYGEEPSLSTTEEKSAEEHSALSKETEAKARLRALDLAISLRKHTK